MTKLSSITIPQKKQGYILSACSACGREGVDVYRRGKFDNIVLCSKHNSQMEKHGYIQTKTYKDPNEVKRYVDHIGIILTNKKQEFVGEAIVSIDMYHLVENIKWHISYGYAKTGWGNKSAFMHRMLFNPPIGLLVDHINGDKLDNRKENIRFCTKSQNAMNSVINWGHTSCKIKGVSFDKKVSKYRSYIKINQKQISGGYFKKEEDAIKSRISLEHKYFKEYSRVLSDKTEHTAGPGRVLP